MSNPTGAPVELSERAALRVLARRLSRRFSAALPRDYVLGKTAMRDAVIELEACSAEQAERRVDALEREGLIVFAGEPGRIGRGAPWRFAAEVADGP